MSDDPELAAIRARDAAVTDMQNFGAQCKEDRRTLLKRLDDARATLKHREELDAFTKPLSCETHGLVVNLASFGNKCAECQRDALAAELAYWKNQATDPVKHAKQNALKAENERLRKALSGLLAAFETDQIDDFTAYEEPIPSAVHAARAALAPT